MSTDVRPKDALFEQFALVAKALASPKRLEMLDVLAQGERSVDALAQSTSLKLTTASAHLQILRQGGLVTSRKDGTRIFYRLAGEDVAKLYLTLRDVAVEHLAGTERAARAYLGTDDLQPVSRDELLDRIKSGQVLLVDVRPETEYAAGHIEGAASIPVDELYDRVSELPKGRDIVAYCRGEYCVFAHDAIRLLRSKGRSARRLQGGILEWRVEERPVVTDTA
jgi:rhodanese-related sulfurtransferase/DNA-binding MarR family transcriptional regulator